MVPVQQEFCACDDQNVEQVMLMSTGVFVVVAFFVNYTSNVYYISFVCTREHELCDEYSF